MFKLPSLNFTKKRTEEKSFLCIVFDPFKVHVAYFELTGLEGEKSRKGQVISAVSRFLPTDSLFEEGGNEDLLVETLSEILDQMKEEFEEIPHEVIFGISSEYCIDLMSIVKLETSTRARFTEEQSNELSEQAEKNAFFRAQDILATKKGDMDMDLEIITSVDIFKKIDGNLTRDPIGLEGQELEFSWFGSFAEDSYLRELKRIAKKLNLKILTVSSKSYSFYRALQDLDSDYRNCVILNLDTGITEVSVAFGGGLVGSRFINMGVISILEQISAKLDLHYDEAEQVLQKYNEGTLDSSIASEVQKVVRRFFVVWSQALNLVFSDFTGIKTFSSKVILVGSGFDIPDISQLVSTENWFKSIPFKNPPDFEKGISSDKLKRVSDLTGISSSLTWTLPLSLSYIYFEIKKEDDI